MCLSVCISVECPAGFTYLPSVNGGCYKVVNENLDWNAAGLRCRSLHTDAHLLVINDAVEQSAVAAMLSSIDCQRLLYVDVPLLYHFQSINQSTRHL